MPADAPKAPTLSAATTVDPSQPIQQGDLLVDLETDDRARRREYMILTADCDIENDKYGSTLLAVELMHTTDYLCHTWYRRWVKTRLTAALKNRSVHTSRVSSDRYVEWVAESRDEEIRTAYDFTEKQWTQEKAVIETVRASRLNPDDQESLLLAIARATNSSDINKAKKPINGFIKSTLPGDAECVNDPFFDGAPRFIDLRRLKPIDPRLIRTSQNPQIRDGLKRTGRLSDRYLFSVVKKFVDVYSSVGLPNNDRDQWVAHITREWDL